MSSDHPPPRRIDGPFRLREFLEDGTEVTRVTDRDLVLRAVNSSLRTEVALGALTAEVAGLGNSVAKIRERLFGGRGSIPDLADAASRLAEAVEEITDHGQERKPDKHDSERVRGKVDEALDAKELEEFRRRVNFRWDVAKQVLGAAGGGALLELCRLLVTGHW